MHFRLEFDETHEKRSEVCPCCGTRTRTVWGFAHRAEETYAAYYVHWTTGHRPAHAMFEIVFGRWGEGSSADDRSACSLEYHEVNGVRAVDFAGPAAFTRIASKLLSREEFLALPEKAELFLLWDTIYLADDRLEGIRRREG